MRCETESVYLDGVCPLDLRWVRDGAARVRALVTGTFELLIANEPVASVASPRTRSTHVAPSGLLRPAPCSAHTPLSLSSGARHSPHARAPSPQALCLTPLSRLSALVSSRPVAWRPTTCRRGGQGRSRRRRSRRRRRPGGWGGGKRAPPRWRWRRESAVGCVFFFYSADRGDERASRARVDVRTR